MLNYNVNGMNICHTCDTCDIESGLNKLKCSKACGFYDITKEFLTYSHPAIVVQLKLLYDIIIQRGFEPSSFGNGTIIPLVKDRQGDISTIDNYRGITLSP